MCPLCDSIMSCATLMLFLSCIHVNTTKLLSTTCTLVAHKCDIRELMSVLGGEGGWEGAKVGGRSLVWAGARDSHSPCKLDGS